MIFTILYRLIR